MWRMPRNPETKGELMGNVESQPWPSPAKPKPAKAPKAEPAPEAE